MNIRFQSNALYYGDCLEIMADFPEHQERRRQPRVEGYYRLRSVHSTKSDVVLHLLHSGTPYWI